MVNRRLLRHGTAVALGVYALLYLSFLRLRPEDNTSVESFLPEGSPVVPPQAQDRSLGGNRRRKSKAKTEPSAAVDADHALAKPASQGLIAADPAATTVESLKLQSDGEQPAPPIADDKRHPKPRVYIYAHLGFYNEKHLAYEHAPIISTLKEMFRDYFVDMYGKYAKQALVRHLRQDHNQKVSSIVFCLVWQRDYVWSFSAKIRHPAAVQPAFQFSSFGAYVILYQTEPWLGFLAGVPKLAQAVGAKEIWEYSRGAVEAQGPTEGDIITRYVPPGCTKYLDLDVGMNGTEPDPGHLGFIGNWQTRTPEVQQEYNVSGRVRAEGAGFTIKTDEDWRLYLERFPMQISVHSKHNPGNLFESFRAAVLLTNGVCMFSQSSSPSDEQEYDGMVKFGTGPRLQELFAEVQDNPKAIQRCRKKSKKLFCSRFSPERLLRQSGFEKVLQSL